MTKYLLRIKNEQGIVESYIENGEGILSFIENESCFRTGNKGYSVKLLDAMSLQLKPVSFGKKTVDYERGSHIRYIYNGKEPIYDEFGDVINELDSMYFPTDM